MPRFNYDPKHEMVREGKDKDIKLESGKPIDFSRRYESISYPGVAFFLWGYALEQRGPEDGYVLSCQDANPDDHDHDEECYFEADESDYWWEEDKTKVRGTMVGDDHVDTWDVSDLRMLHPLGYCTECGQVGAYCDFRYRSPYMLRRLRKSTAA